MRQVVLGYMLATTPPEYNGRGGGVGGDGLDSDHPSMRQVVLGYMLPTTPPEYNGRGGGVGTV